MVEYFLKPDFSATNGLFYHPTNDTIPGRRWVKLQIQSQDGETSTLTISNYEMNILVAQIAATQSEHNWSPNER